MNYASSCMEPFPTNLEVFEVPIEQNKNKLLVVRVLKGAVPSASKGVYYRRTGEGDSRLSIPEAQKLIAEFQEFDYSKKQFRTALFQNVFDENRYKEFVQLYQKRKGVEVKLEPEIFLERICTVIDEHEGKKFFNAAGVLLFSNKPQYFVPQSKIRCIKYNGRDITSDIIDEKEVEGNLIEMIESAFNFVKTNIRKSGKVVGTRTEYEYEYPDITFRESIINAVSHRNYLQQSLEAQVFIFDNRIEIISPGVFPKKSLQNNIPLNPAPRNPLIADLLQSCEYGDKIGSGVKKILSAMKSMNRKPPTFNDEDRRAKVILWGENALVDDLLSKYDLSKNQVKAMEIVLSQGFIQTGQFAELVKSSRPTARDELDQLVRLKILIKKGAGRSSKYVLIKKLESSI